MKEAEKISFKKNIVQSCRIILEKRIAVAQQAMQQAQESANSEEKSSAGDKYETARAMGQQSRDMNAKQLEEANRDLAFIHLLPVSKIFNVVQNGSVVITNHFTFFIALGLGIIEADGKKVVLLSPSAPVARMLTGKKAGEQFLFNGVKTKIIDIY